MEVEVAALDSSVANIHASTEDAQADGNDNSSSSSSSSSFSGSSFGNDAEEEEEEAEVLELHEAFEESDHLWRQMQWEQGFFIHRLNEHHG
jgi:hypothetical protein